MADKVREDSGNEIKVNCCCIGNSGGICRVEKCAGEIGRLQVNDKDPDRAAWRYETAKKSFEDYFSEDYKDTDTEG